MDERFDRIDQTLDRMLTLLMDHGRRFDELERRLHEIHLQLIEADVHLMAIPRFR